MQLYRDLQDGEIIQQGDRILTADAGFQPVRGCVGKQHSTKNHFVIQRPVEVVPGNEDFILDVATIETTGEFAAPVNQKSDAEIVTQIIKVIRWQDLHQQDSADMLGFLMNRYAAISMSDITGSIDRNSDQVSLIQADSHRAAFNTDCLMKIISSLLNELRELREKDADKKPWYKFWSGV